MAGETFTSVFTAPTGDYGLVTLKRILGCTVDAVWHGQSCAEAGMIAAAAGFFNLAIAIVAGLLVTYTVWTAVADTARDGEAFGGGVSMPYTTARVGLGVVLLLPVAGGFSLAQLLVIQLLVWGSGAADNLWSRVNTLVSTGGYNQVASMDQHDARMRGMIASAIQVRALGHVCAARLNEIASSYGAGDPIQPADTSQGFNGGFIGLVGGNSASRSYFFKDTQNFFNGTQSLCGIVSYQIGNSYKFPASNSPMNAADQDTYTTLKTIAENAVNTGLLSAWNSIDQSSRKVAQFVVDGERDDSAIQSLIINGISEAQSNISNAMNSSLSDSSGDVQKIAQQYLAHASENGWIFAASWQRAGINMTQFFQSLVNSVSFTATPPGSLAVLLQPMAQPGWFGRPAQISGSTWRTISDAYERDMGYLGGQSGFVANLASAAPLSIGGEQRISRGSDFSVAAVMQKVLGALNIQGANDAVQFSDPLANLVQIGSWLANWGFTALAGGGTLGVASSVGALLGFGGLAAGAVAAEAGNAIWFLGVVFVASGFWMGGILPLTPMLYFFGGVISWLVIGLEALIAVPIWVLTHFFPAREPSLIGASRQGYLLLFGLLIRPSLIVFGLIMSVLVMFAAFTILNIMFRSAFSLMMPLDGGSGAAIMSAALIVSYLTAATVIVTNSCALITDLGDSVLRWIEVGVQSLWNNRFASDAMQQIAPHRPTAPVSEGAAAMPTSLRRIGTTPKS